MSTVSPDVADAVDATDPPERMFEIATVFWLGAAFPPLGAVLSLSAIVESIRRRAIPPAARWGVVPMALLPGAWLLHWTWSRLTEPRLIEAEGVVRPFLSPATLSFLDWLMIGSIALHVTAGSLCGALWGARTAPAGGTLLRSIVGAVAAAGWAWLALGAYLAWQHASVGGAGLALGAGFGVVAIGALVQARRVDSGDALDWTRVAD